MNRVFGDIGRYARIRLVRAFALAPTALVFPFHYTKLLWVTIIGFSVVGEFPSPNPGAGSALVVAGGLYVVRREGRRA